MAPVADIERRGFAAGQGTPTPAELEMVEAAVPPTVTVPPLNS